MGRAHDLIFVAEYEYETPARERRYVDGALVADLRVPFGFWEAKDEKDDLEEEIRTKFRRGYPQDNIIFEDSRRAILYQNGKRVIEADTEDVDALERLLKLFFGYEQPQIAEFRKAVEKFKDDLPQVLKGLRETMDEAEKAKPEFHAALLKFLKHAQETINPSLGAADVREMLIQHILTEEIFTHVFDNSEFHTHNNVARELYALENTFFTGGIKRDTLARLKSYYAAIRSAAALVSSHHEKQQFLKVIYENFYKVYNQKAADRLGVVYTPNEIVRFMIESADWLCQKHFKKNLIDNDVEILDPATGTGTFIVEMIEHFRGQPEKLRHKYLEELHANEVAILPYYVANLNIEATYAAITRKYEEYPNLCFVDTLDNLGWSRGKDSRGAVGDLFGAVSEENVQRIQRQNSRKISVVIGNPPYNANQASENDENKNREYPAIDKRVKQTYIEAGSARKPKYRDPYIRFFRWASDRIERDGIVAFVSNSSFVHKPSFDGMRRVLSKEFNEIVIIDLKGDARTSGDRRRREGGNVFGDQIKVGISITFLTKKHGTHGCRILYQAIRDNAKADEKVSFLQHDLLREHPLTELQLDEKGNWIPISDAGYSRLIPIADKATKGTRISSQDRAIFKLYALGISTNRDGWLYDFDREILEAKAKLLISEYDRIPKSTNSYPLTIKWSRNLKRRLAQGKREKFDSAKIVRANYRPFAPRWLYQSGLFVDEFGGADQMFPPGYSNTAICFSDKGSRTDVCLLATRGLADLHFGAAVDAYQQVARYRYADGERLDNITDWAQQQFREHYEQSKAPKRSIDKDAIFHYVYGVLHDPAYREKYAQNLKREFPRIPFYADFWKWADWGKRLMEFHIGYETVEPWPLKRVDEVDKTAKKSGIAPKAILKPLKDTGGIRLDSDTQLTGVPKEAWDYRLGNRSALDWVLDQYKEKTPKDPTIREKFNTYRFAGYKDQVIDLLKRVTRVSVETMKIIEEMKAAKNAR